MPSKTSDRSGGRFVVNTSTVTFTGNLSAQNITSRGNPFYNLYVNGGSSGYWTQQDSMTVTSNLTLNKGTLDTSATSCGGASCNIAPETRPSGVCNAA